MNHDAVVSGKMEL